MSDNIQPTENGSTAVLSAGMQLRLAREAKGLSLDEVAGLLKISPGKLAALEADDHASLKGAAFVRSLALATCRVLKIDSASVLDLLPGGFEDSLQHVATGLNAPFKESQYRRTASQGFRFETVHWVGLALLMGALALVLIPDEWTHISLPNWASTGTATTQVTDSSRSASQPGAVVAQSSSQTVSLPLDLPRPAASASGISAEANAASAVLADASVNKSGQDKSAPGFVASGNALATTASAASTAKPNSASTSASGPSAAVMPLAVSAASAGSRSLAAASSPAAAVSGQALVVHAKGQTWVEVLDSRGNSLLSRNLASGETVSLSGQAPLTIKVGNVQATQLTWRGKPVDLEGRSLNNVARLELN